MPYFFGREPVQQPELRQTEQTLAATLERMSEVFRRSFRESPDYEGLSPLQLKLVAFLGSRPEGTSLTRIAEAFAMAKSTLSVSLQALEKKAIITKEADPGDRRRSLIRLQPRGEQLSQRLGGFQQAILGGIRELPPKRQQQMLVGMLELLHHFQRIGLVSLTGMCHDCHYLASNTPEPYCELLNQPLGETDIPLSWYQPMAGA